MIGLFQSSTDESIFIGTVYRHSSSKIVQFVNEQSEVPQATNKIRRGSVKETKKIADVKECREKFLLSLSSIQDLTRSS